MSTNMSTAVTATPPQASTCGSYIRGVLFCVAATFSFGVMFPVMTDALRHIDPFTFTTLRYLIAGTAFLILLVAREGVGTLSLKGERIAFAWFLGSIGFAGFGFFVFLGQQLAGRDGALTASIMMATQPMIGLLLNSAVRRIRPPLYSFLFILMSFCGVALVVTKGDIVGLWNEPQNYAANALIVLGAACWVVYTFSAMYFPTWSAFKYTTVTTWLGLSTIMVVNLLLFATRAIPVPHLSTLGVIGPHLLYMGLVAGFCGILCWNLGNKILTPLNGVLFMDVVPITTFVVSSLNGVIPTNAQIAGACMSGAALILNNAYLRARARRQVTAK